MTAASNPAPPAGSADPPRRRAADRDGRAVARAASAPGPRTLRLSLASGTRVENTVAVFLLGAIAGAAAVWVEADRHPGALRTAATDAAPFAVAVAVPIAGLLALVEPRTTRWQKGWRGGLYALFAATASMLLATGGLLALNARGEGEAITRDCLVARRDTVPGKESGVRDWIVVVRCSDAMSGVSIDVSRDQWWDHEPGTAVAARLRRGRLGYEWVEEVPDLGPPRRRM